MKRTLILPALLLLAGCGDDPAELLDKAKAAYSANDYRTARVHLAAALSEEPTNREMLLLQARTQIALGDGEGAGATLERVGGSAPPSGEEAELTAEAALLRQAPDVVLATLAGMTSPESERLRALALLQRGKTADAGERFEAGLKAGGNPRLLADYARYKLLTGDGPGARELVAQAEKAAPNGLDTLLVSGQIALGEGRLGEALDRYSRASQIYPASLAAISGKAATLGELGRIKEMTDVVESAAAFAPGDPTIVYLRAKVAAAGKDWAKVRAIVQPLETRLPQLSPARQVYGEALLRLGQHELAVTQLAPLANAQRGNGELRQLLAEAQLASGNAASAVATLRPSADSATASVQELALMARAANAAGDPKAAFYEQRSRLPAPEALIKDIAEGDAAIRSRDWARAIAAYDRILKATDGKNAMVLNNMAYSQLMVGNIAKAQDFAARALKQAPDNASVLDTAGWVRFKANDRPEALRLLRLAAAKAPQNPNIRAHLAEAERAG